MNEDDKATLWIGAFRYWLGRQTVSVHGFCEHLIHEFDGLPDQAKSVINRELQEAFYERAFNRMRLGHDIDRKKWEEVLEVVTK